MTKTIISGLLVISLCLLLTKPIWAVCTNSSCDQCVGCLDPPPLGSHYRINRLCVSGFSCFSGITIHGFSMTKINPGDAAQLYPQVQWTSFVGNRFCSDFFFDNQEFCPNLLGLDTAKGEGNADWCTFPCPASLLLIGTHTLRDRITDQIVSEGIAASNCIVVDDCIAGPQPK